MEPDSIADRGMRIDYAPSSIGGQGQFSRADDQFKVYNFFNSQSVPRILASLSRPLEPLQHDHKVSNTLAKSREESRREGEEFLIAKISPDQSRSPTVNVSLFLQPSSLRPNASAVRPRFVCGPLR